MDSERLQHAVDLMQELVNTEHIPFGRLLVARRGRLIFDRSVDGCLPSAKHANGLYRLFSLSKIFTSVAYGVLMEKYNVHLDSAVADYLGDAWRNQRVHVSGGEAGGSPAVLEPAQRPVTLRDCLTHTAGLTYGGLLAPMGIVSYTDALMDAASISVTSLISQDGIEQWCTNVGSLARHCELLATIPLKFQPGSTYEYAVGHIIVGRVIEVVSGMPLKEFVRREVLEPLGCSSVCGWLPPSKSDLLPYFVFKSVLEDPPREDFDSGITDPGEDSLGSMHTNDGFRKLDAAVWADAQMVGMAEDVLRLTNMLTQRGKTADGRQLLSRATADLIQSNCLPGGTFLNWSYMPPHSPNMTGTGAPLKAKFDEEGSVGYGLGGLVHREGGTALLGSVSCAPGSYHWGGAACTLLQADVRNGLSIVFMTQLIGAHEQPELSPAGKLFQKVYQAIVD